MTKRQFKRLLKEFEKSNDDYLEINGLRINKNDCKRLLYGYICIIRGDRYIKVNYSNFFENIPILKERFK